MEYVTKLGSLEHYEKGAVEVINDDPKNYAFSNIFEVASHAKPFEKIAVGKNFQYVLEAVRVEGVSEWRVCVHDESALVMDGEVEFTFRTVDDPPELPEGGSVALPDEPAGQPMGRVVARRGHLTLLPAGRAYRYAADRPAVLLIQTVEGVDTQYRWAEICQTA
ncbi:MAG: hypothetical protein ACM3ML_21395 [Micromonosporaceae bacterium]